ncbi:phenylalanine--tRNA ligase subunit beta [Candidatus Saccharibacteria bacterium]|nr:phenylalanine--tRNA ligase subunit beta [Candidatus Saccharibacteria bacterium]
MRISLNWLKKYVNIPVPDEELVRLIGARLVEVEGVIDETHKYDKIYVVRVETAEKIEGTHLTLCQINNGGDDLVQVVCGAPNVRAGMLAAWIAPGAVVPVSVHEDAPFVIGKRKMLGKYDSNGMLAGADELDFGGEHSGIVEIDPKMAQPGVPLADVFGLKDLILDIENKSLTHRPDCFGIIGFAREVAGILGEKFKEPSFLMKEDTFPEGFFIYNDENSIKKKDSSIKIDIKDPAICGRYTVAVIKNTEAMLGEEKYLTLRDTLLAKSGMHKISKIVDVTNYLMLLTGQPLHAFDYDKFLKVGGTENPNIIVRTATDGEKLTLLDGSEIVCNKDDILITSNNVPVALAGAMGGANTEIDENTRQILIESASFSLYNLRKTQMSHGIFSEAITRFTKGVPTTGTFNVLAEAVKEIGGKSLDFNDNWPDYHGAHVVKITTDEINSLLGTKYSKDLIVKTLVNVGFIIEAKSENLEICVPTWRTDIHIKEDIIEEIGRLLGYDNIEPTLPRHATAVPNKMLQFKTEIRDIMSKFGANEVLTYSFVSERLLEKAGLKAENSYKIVNSISPELQYIRQSIVPSLLDKAYTNQKIPFDQFSLFEINKVYQKAWGMDAEDVPVEKMRMGFVVAERKNPNTPYYKAKFFAEKLLEELNIAVKFLPLKNKDAESLPFEPKRAAEIWVNDICLGVVGEFKNSVRHSFKLAEFLAGFELDVDAMLNLEKNKIINNNFEVKDKQDLTITTTETYGKVLEKVKDKYPNAKITPVAIYQPECTKEKNITFHLEFY